ncbi:MAG: GAF domain-containing protein [Candidatus Glassbacteria bacterium]|nr:GAF domain-containing protein [Candidatus Glassbacteria bacterium]
MTQVAAKLDETGFHLRDLADTEARGTLPEPVIFLVDSDGWKRFGRQVREFIVASHYHIPLLLIDDGDYGPEEPYEVNTLLSAEFSEKQLLIALREAYRNSTLRREIERLRSLLGSGQQDLQKLIEIGISLSSEHDIDRLLIKILTEACNVTIADAGSIYIIDRNEDGQQVLRFRNTLGHSLKIDFKEFTIPIGPDSIAGYVALTGESLILDDCYHVPKQYAFSINRSFDENNNYRTKSMLAVAMRNQKDEITGVIQLINRKPSPELILSSPGIAENEVIPFDERSRDLIGALASQAAVALENYKLYRDIENLFEGFVQASVFAIESRDPTTCGHSERVATLTMETAKLVDRLSSGPYKDVRFSQNQLKEIRYAGLLHDFGKVGVRENVLLKAKKLYPEHLLLIKQRFDVVRQIILKEANRIKVEKLLAEGRREYLDKFENADRELEQRLATLDEYLQLVVTANEPSVLVEESSKRLEELAQVIIEDADLGKFQLLEEDEYKLLTIPRGSLSAEERREIESHVTHSFNFLNKIPWTSDLNNIPQIAYGHHEKLDGTGYPLRLASKKIAIQTRMMTISDIYDALAAQDRPYKPALPPERALDILNWEVKEGKLDGELLKVFVEGKVYETTRSE